MINEDITDQQSEIQEYRRKLAEDELRNIKEGKTYNAPNTYLHADPEDIDSQVVETAGQIIKETNVNAPQPAPQPVSTEQPTPEPTKQPQEGKPKHLLDIHSGMKLDANPATWAYLTAMGALDVPMDVIGLVPGLGALDDKWDEVTKFDDEGANRFRATASFILPTVLTAGAYAKAVGASKLTGITKAAANVGGMGAINSAMALISDYGEDPTNRLLTSPAAFRFFSDKFPEIFGPQGTYPISEDLKTLDGTSPEMNKLLAGIDEGVLSGFGDLLGYAFNAGKPLLWNIKGQDKVAKNWKRSTQLKHMERDTKNRIMDIDAAIQSGGLKEQQVKQLVDEKNLLIKQIEETGQSQATQNAGESFVRERQRSRNVARDRRAVEKVVANPTATNLDPDITPKLTSETLQEGKPPIPGSAVKNTIDVAAQEAGEHARNAVPTAPYTDAMRKKGLVLGKSHHMVADIAKKVRQAGKYVDFQDKWNKNERSKAVWKIYEKIMKPGTGEALEKILNAKQYNTVTDVLDEFENATSVKYLNPQATEAAALAISDLLDVYIGRESQETAARVMSTLGKEISAISGNGVTFKTLLDDDVVMKNILDRVELLEAQYGSSKYVAGWTLNNLKWWKRWKKGNVAENAIMTLKEFEENGRKTHAAAKTWRQELEKAMAENPALANALKEAYDYTDGDVNSIRGLNKWISAQLTPAGLLVNQGTRGMNLFAKGAWAVTYNNVLSGLSGLRALVGNGTQLILRPLTTLTRSGVRSILKRDIEPLERAVYLHGAVFETTRRALGDAMQRMRRVNSDPDFMMKAIRKDYTSADDGAYQILDTAEELLTPAQKFFYGWAKLNRNVSRMRWARYGMTSMAGVDAFTDTFMATMHSRIRAYDDVFSKYGKTTDPQVFSKALKEAEELNYSTMFDKNGLLTDKAAKNSSGEIALNLDDGITNWLNQGINEIPAAKVLMMFPRTGINQVKAALSYTPIGLIPGWKSKYGLVLQAGDDIGKIKKALEAHGIKNFDETPNAMAIYKQLKDEYEGRIMLGSATAIFGYNYALSGGIRGNGPANTAERQDLKRKGWKPYTVKIGNNWVSYKGIPMIEQMFALVGDLAYYQTAIGQNMTTSFVDKLGWTISATFLNNTPLYGIEPFLAITGGNEAEFKRLAANIVRGAIPMNGAVGVIANAITQAQKDIYDDFLGYVLNTTPLKPILPSQTDHWTGEKINEVDNHFLRILNAFSPQKVSGGEEPWRLWLINSGFDDMGILKKKFDSDVDYTAEQREVIGKLMGEDQLWKVIEKDFVNNRRWNEELDEMRKFVNTPGRSAQEIRDYNQSSPVYQELSNLIKRSQQRAEARMAMDPKYRHLDIQGTGRAITKSYMKKGLIEKAKQNADMNKQIDELLNLPR